MHEAAILTALFVIVTMEQALVLHGFPVELVLPAALLQMGRTAPNVALVFLVGVAATTVGAWIAFEAARLGRRRLRGGRSSRLAAWMGKRIQGRASLVAGVRLVPFARSLVSPVAGAVGMPRRTYLVWTTIGNSAFTAVLVGGALLLP